MLFIIYLPQKATVLFKYLRVSYHNMVFYAYKWSVFAEQKKKNEAYLYMWWSWFLVDKDLHEAKNEIQQLNCQYLIQIMVLAWLEDISQICSPTLSFLLIQGPPLLAVSPKGATRSDLVRLGLIGTKSLISGNYFDEPNQTILLLENQTSLN